jgi:hypothetical protein
MKLGMAGAPFSGFMDLTTYGGPGRSRQVTAGHPVGSVSLWCSLGESIPTDIKNGFVRNTTKCLPI